jgi:hypothetical protein
MDINAMMTGKFSYSRKRVLLATMSLMGLLLLAFIYASNTDWDDEVFHPPTRYNITSLLEGGAGDDMTTDRKGKVKKNANAAEVEKGVKVSKTTKMAKRDKEEDDDHRDEAKTVAVPVGDGSGKASKTGKVPMDDEGEDGHLGEDKEEDDDHQDEVISGAVPGGDGSGKATKTGKVPKDYEREDDHLDGDEEEDDDHPDEAKTGAVAGGDGGGKATKTGKVRKDDVGEDESLGRIKL